VGAADPPAVATPFPTAPQCHSFTVETGRESRNDVVKHEYRRRGLRTQPSEALWSTSLGHTWAISGVPCRMVDAFEALDAYLATVVQVAEKVLPSVASLRVPTRRGDGAGSASVLTSDGFLLTSAHVVEGADTVEAAFTDGATIGVNVIGRDPLSDLAVLRARGAVPAPALFGDAARCESGSW